MTGNILTDFHCHRFAGDEAGICSVSYREWEKTGAERCPGQFLSMQFHPWDAADISGEEQSAAAEKLSSATALGEIGLDRACKTEYEEQIRVFRAALKLGAASGKPVIIHEVRSQSEILSMLKDYPAKVMIHHAPHRQGKIVPYLERGYLLSFSEVPPDIVPLESFGLESDDGAADLAELYRASAVRRRMDLSVFIRRMSENFYRFIGEI